jgi:organic radical activating enzyme
MPNPNLKVFDIFYGNKCQIACQQCDTRSDLIRKGEHDPDLETIKEGILLTKEKFHIEHYSLLGGEPLLYKNKIESIVPVEHNEIKYIQIQNNKRKNKKKNRKHKKTNQ